MLAQIRVTMGSCTHATGMQECTVMGVGTDTTTASGLGRIIRKAREGKGLSREKLAARLGRTSSTIQRWESGDSDPTFVDIVRLAAITGADIEELAEAIDTSGVHPLADVCTGQLTLDDVVIDLRDGRARTYIAAAA